MSRSFRALLLLAVGLMPAPGLVAASLAVASDFEGASVRVLGIDHEARSIRFSPGGDPERGWPCWWHFRVRGLAEDQPLTLRLRGSRASLEGREPLAAAWAMPERASYSIDGERWLQTEPGERREEWMIYTIPPGSPAVWVAWGPPYTPAFARRAVRDMADASPHAEARELGRSKDGRTVPMLHVRQGERPASERFGVWIQARQHAWESGSSWVAHGFGEWLLGDHPEASWLREHAELFVIPVMDVDNAATGNGGKNALPHDHNRDWSDDPHWNEVAAAMKHVRQLIDERRMDLFLDIHNPAPRDDSFFYVLPEELLEQPAIARRNRFLELAHARLAAIEPPIPLRPRPKPTGPNYHPRWRNISSNWVAMNGNPDTVAVCFEAAWNHEHSTAAGYRATGAALAAATRTFLAAPHRE